MTAPLSPAVDGFAEESPFALLSPAVDTFTHVNTNPLSPGADETYPQAPLPLSPAFEIRAIPIPPQSYSGISGGSAAIASARSFSGTSSGRVPAVASTSYFGGRTDGSTKGLPAPQNLTATAVDAGCVRLDWDAPGAEEDSFRIERSLTGVDDWATIGTVAADVVTFLDRFAVPLIIYDYRVLGIDASRESLPSNIATAGTPLPPELPTSLPPTSTSEVRNTLTPRLRDIHSPGVFPFEAE